MVTTWELCVVIIGFFEFVVSNNLMGDVAYPQSHLTEDSKVHHFGKSNLDEC